MGNVRTTTEYPPQMAKKTNPPGRKFEIMEGHERKIFLVINGIYPKKLGRIIPILLIQPMLRDTCSFEAVLDQYENEFRAILGQVKFGEDQVWKISAILKEGHLYAGGDGSSKEGRGSHA